MGSESRFQGCVVGLACGDALGYPTEFVSSMEAIRRMYPPNGIEDLQQATLRLPRSDEEGARPMALFTDDTQMSLAAAKGILRAGMRATAETSAPFVVEEFVAWARAPVGGHRAPGGACMSGCYRLASGAPWATAGDTNAGGCGAVMRSAPYGLRWCRDVDAAVDAAVRHARMTHGCPMGYAPAGALAAGVALLVREGSPTKASVVLAMRDVAGKYDAKTRADIHEAIAYAQDADGAFHKGNADEALDRFRGWRGDECIAAAVFCFLAGDSYVDVVRMAANTPGDSDSIACVAGALAGAHYGIDQIPAHWQRMIERSTELFHTANALAVASGG